MNNYTEITYAASWCVIVWTVCVLIASVCCALKDYLAWRNERESDSEEEEEPQEDGSREYWRNRALMFKDWYYREVESFNEHMDDYNELQSELSSLEEENADLRYKLRQYEEAKERKNGIAVTDSGNEQSREEFGDRGNADV